MTRRAVVQPRADQDIRERFEYLMREAGQAIAIRFQAAVIRETDRLLGTPGKGSPRRFRRSRLVGLRQWPVAGFDNVLIFYRPTTYGIEVVRVLHGAQDVQRILRRER